MEKQVSPLDNWEFCNKVLYDMCKIEPLHIDPKIVASKALIIGRTYAAALERRKPVDGSTQMNVNDLYETLFSAFTQLDDDLKKLSGDRVDKTNFDVVVQIHDDFVNRIYKCPDMNLRKPSFASKYLHFHKREFFFIYDSIASERVGKLIKTDKITKAYLSLPKNLGDVRYAEFVRKCLILRENLECDELQYSTREIDNHLLYSFS